MNFPLHVGATHFASRSFRHKISSVTSMSRWFLLYIVLVVAVPFLLFLFKTILACIKAGGRNKPSIGIKALPFSRSSGYTLWKQRQKLPISPKQIYHCSVILRCFKGSIELAQAWYKRIFQASLKACLHGVGDPGLVGLVSFVFTLWGTQNKRNLPH